MNPRGRPNEAFGDTATNPQFPPPLPPARQRPRFPRVPAPLDRLELLERLLAVVAVMDRFAGGGPELALPFGVRGAAVGAGGATHRRHQRNERLLDDGVVGRSDAVGLELRLGLVAQPVGGPCRRVYRPE